MRKKTTGRVNTGVPVSLTPAQKAHIDAQVKKYNALAPNRSRYIQLLIALDEHLNLLGNPANFVGMDASSEEEERLVRGVVDQSIQSEPPSVAKRKR